jgi:ribosomal protein S4E
MPSRGRSRKKQKMPVTESDVILIEDVGEKATVKPVRSRRRKKITLTEETVEVKEEPADHEVVVSGGEDSERVDEAVAVPHVQSSVRKFSSPKKAKTNNSVVPAVSSSSVQQGSGPLRSLFDKIGRR